MSESSPVSSTVHSIYEMYQRMENEDIILAFKGNITEDMLTAVYDTMEKRLETDSVDIRLRKKINNILIECLQNVYHHFEVFSEDEKKGGLSGTAIFLISRAKNNKYRVITGNHILSTEESKLKNQI